MIKTELDNNFNALYSELVPGSGKAETFEGELLRATARIVYRYYNDGDFFFENYGAETAGPPATFLKENAPDVTNISSLIIEIASVGQRGLGDVSEVYIAFLNNLVEEVSTYVASKTGNLTPNTKDMWETKSHWENFQMDDSFYGEDDSDFSTIPNKY
jgi:hypothetical protein